MKRVSREDASAVLKILINLIICNTLHATVECFKLRLMRERKQPVVNLPHYFFLLFQTKYALLDEQDIGLVEQYAFEVSTIFSISSLLFPYSTFLCPASHQSVALFPFISEVKSIVHADSQQRSLRSILIDGQYCERSFALLPALTESSLHHRGVTRTMSRERRPYNVLAHWKFETGNYLTYLMSIVHKQGPIYIYVFI